MDTMRLLQLPKDELFHCVMTGKFIAPTPDWKHEHFTLEEFELIVVTEGILYLSYDLERFTVKKGEYLLLPPCHAWRDGFQAAYSEFYWLHFSTSTMTCMSEVNSIQIPQTGKIPKPEKMIVLMKQLQDSVKSGYPTISLDAMTTSIMTELYAQLYKTAPVYTQPDHIKQIYADIIDYIDLHISENPKVSAIAAHFGYNEKYLSHVFTKVTGTSMKQYIITRKIDTANSMLTDTNSSIEDIGKAIGFTDSHNFSRAYKQVMGLTPSEYRNAFARRLTNHK